MSVYLLINIVIVIFPLLLSLLPYFKFREKWPALFTSILLVGGSFIIWDSLVTWRGDWSFNPAFVTGYRLLGLPVEELLFFFTVPYSCIFLYEGLVRFSKERTLSHPKYLYLFLGIALILASLFLRDKGYTSIVLFVSGVLFLLGTNKLKALFSSSLYWHWILDCTFLFLIFNYFLTSLPILIYNPQAILNIRVLTIPIEDFFYNFSLLTLYLAVYRQFRRG